MALVVSQLSVSDAAAADEGAGEIGDELITLGTRRPDRTRQTSIVPVDVLYPEDFLHVGYTDLAQILANLVPSFTHFAGILRARQVPPVSSTLGSISASERLLGVPHCLRSCNP